MAAIIPSQAFVLSFVATVVGCVFCFTLALRKANAGRAPRVPVLIQTAWMALVALLAMTGVLGRFDAVPPPVLPVFAITTGLTIWFARSEQGRRVSELPLSWLVGFQGFRVVVELLLHRGYVEGFVPRELTYSGHNFDMLSGVLGIALGIWASKATPPRWVLLGYNVLGLALLGIVVTTAVLAMPTRFQVLHTDPPNVWVAEVPFVWLPTVLVQAALLGHLLLFRRLATRGPAVLPAS
ncbi:MAG: hypothetical protein KC492_27910 [Myxococcales bacterium]|nr:hypothetical protein [Myxococcales bacterium]MCB9606735.1 hypothetical protein [Polyangiaceae bacterium]